MRPLLVLTACVVVGVPATVALAMVITAVWYERYWLPRIAGQE